MEEEYHEEEYECGEEEELEEEYRGPGDQQEAEKPSKEENQVAKWMRKNIRTKKTKFLSHNVEYFTSNKAIDALLKSKFAEGASPLFTTREQIVEFLDVMLEHKFFHRAKKVPIVIDDCKGASCGKNASNEASGNASTSSTPKPTKKDKEDKKKKDVECAKGNKDSGKDKDTETEASETTQGGKGCVNVGCAKCAAQIDEMIKKRKRKIRLDMHPEQVFVDGSEAYVWIYDPIPIHYWIYGLVLLLGAIVICLFPLWPPMLRKGVYYLSIAAAGFLVFILVLTVVRLILFTIVWAITGGKLNFWIFPNLTEDVGFFASFWPLYESKYVNDDGKSKNDKRSKSKSKKKQKDKDSDVEDEVGGEVEPLEPEKIEEVKEHDAEIELRRRNVGGGDGADEHSNNGQDEDSHSSAGDNSEAAAESSASDAKCSRTPSESESEISGKDYEIINSSEVQNVN